MFVACGLNHKTAPLNVREKIAIPESRHGALLHELVGLPAVNEAVILSTCNRTEIYCDTDKPEHIVTWLAEANGLEPGALASCFYSHHDHEGIRHALRVASGMDSMMLGEPQILGQMKQAWQQACQAGTTGNMMRQVFPWLFGASKRIRTRSGIGNNPVSVAYAAVQLVARLLTDFSLLNVFVIGSGETSALVTKYLQQQGVRKFMIASRTRENALMLAETCVGEALTIADIPYRLQEADVVISATACPLPFISKNLVRHAMEQRHHAPMVFLDLAVPRDIEPDVAELEHVHLYNLDDLQKMTEQGMNDRLEAARHAEQLIDAELDNYSRWHRSLQAKDVICNYRNQMQDLARQELERAMQKLSAGQCQYSVLNEFSERLIKKLTHMPTVGLRKAARDNRGEIMDLVSYLLNSPESTNP